MRSVIAVLFVILLAGAAVGVLFSAFIVGQNQQALVFEFGRFVRVINEPGLRWRVPFVQTVEYYDKRLLDIETDATQIIASDQKRLVVDSFARYRIVDPQRFYQSFRTEAVARQRLTANLDSTLRNVLGGAAFIDIVRTRGQQLMKQIADQMTNDVGASGVQIVDVRIKRADLPEANTQAIYRRMQTERQREASELRAQGSEQSQRIKSTADRQVTILVAEANRDAERLRGEGDAERNRIYAEAFGRDPDFFGFYRSMQSYEEALKGNGTRIVLSPTSEFFRYFNNSPSAVGTPGQPPRPALQNPAPPVPR